MEQAVSFALVDIKAISSRWPGEGVVSNLVVWPNGTLEFTMAPGRFGRFAMDIIISDDGGTEFGGLDSSVVTVPLNILAPNDEFGNPLESVPVLQGPRQLTVPEAKGEIQQTFSNYLMDVSLEMLAPVDREKIFHFKVDNSNPFLFLDGPNITYPDGTVSFTLRPYANGVSRLSIYLVSTDDVSFAVGENTFPLDIVYF